MGARAPCETHDLHYFADTTLVHLAWRESLATVFTIDHDDFETYRIEGKKRFRILPDRLAASRLTPR
jgi:hypothetical protein